MFVVLSSLFMYRLYLLHFSLCFYRPSLSCCPLVHARLNSISLFFLWFVCTTTAVAAAKLVPGGPLQHNQAPVPLHQMTASAVGNTPEKDLDVVKEGILRGVMHADEHMFEFKVCTCVRGVCFHLVVVAHVG